MVDFEKIKKAGKFLPDDGFDQYWDKFNKENVKAKKLEFLQSYAFIDGNEDFDNKNYDGFANFLLDFYKNAWGGKENIKRLRFVKRPIEGYLEMEYYTYIVDELNGQEVRFTEQRELFPEKVCDFVLFENGNLFILDFGNNDCWKGAWLVTDKDIIKELSDWYDRVFERAKNFKGMLTPNQEIVLKMKERGIPLFDKVESFSL